MVKMIYNQIDIKWWLVSTSFRIYLAILSNFNMTFTIFQYNTISLKCTFLSCSSLRPLSNRIIHFTCNPVSTHLTHRRIFLFSTRCGVGSLLCMRNINCKPHWLAICYLSRIFYFFSIDSSEARKQYNEYCLSIMQTITYAHDRTHFQCTTYTNFWSIICPLEVDLREWNW